MAVEVRKVTVQAAFGKNHRSTILSGDWTDLTAWAREVTWQFGRSNELDAFDTGTATITLLNRDRRFDPNNASSPYVGQLLPNVPVRIRSVNQSTLNLTGASGSRASTPDHANLDITGDIDLRADVNLTDWTPAASETLISKWNITGSQRSWLFQVTSTGLLRLITSPDGSEVNAILTDSTTAVVPPASGRLVVRVTLDVNDGAGGKVTTFYTGLTTHGPWTQLGSAITAAGTTSIFSSTATVELGASSAGTIERLTGQIHRAEILTGINGFVMANPDFTGRKLGTTSFVDTVGRTWTVNSPANIIAGNVYDDEFYGFIQSGWQQDLAPKGSDECRIELVDRFGLMTGVKLPDVYEHAIMMHNPVGFWMLNGGSHEGGESEEVVDMGSGRHNGSLLGDGVTLGDKPIFPGGDPAARFDVTVDPATSEVTTYGAVEITRSRITTGSTADPLVVITFNARSKGVLNRRHMFIHADGTSPGTGYQAHIDTGGKLVYSWIVNGGGIAYQSVNPVVGRVGLFDNSTGHIMFGAGSGLGLDTPTLSASPTVTPSLGTKTGVAIGGGRGIAPIDHMDGWIGSVAVFASNTTVGTAGRQAIFDAFKRLSGQRTDEHIAWALDWLGVPAGSRNLDIGTVILGPAHTGEQDVMGCLQETAAAEGGDIYVDHRDGGKIRFTNRYARFLNARSTSSQATFSDDPGAHSDTVIRYPAEGLDISPNGWDGIVNQVTASWHDGSVTVADQPSIDAYGPRPRDIDTGTMAAQARSAAEWMLTRYKSPRSRIRGVAVGAKTFNRHDSLAQVLRIDDRITFRVHPLKTGAATTVSLFVDGVTHSARGMEWTTSFRFAPVDTFTPWIWGTSTWGTSKVWG